jgi:hypothetical protein
MLGISVSTYNYHLTLFRRLVGYFTRLIQILGAGDRVFYLSLPEAVSPTL